MARGPLYLHRIGYELPPWAHQTDWIDNSRYILSCGKVLRRLLSLRMFSTGSGRQLIKIEVENAPSPEILSLDDGVYLQVRKGARLLGIHNVTLKPGIHSISSVIRMCRNKLLNAQNEEVWALRKNLLQTIEASFNRLHAGIYEFRTRRERAPGAQAQSMCRVRRPDYVAGSLTAAEEISLAEHVHEWAGRMLRTEPLNRDRLNEAINHLYNSFGLDDPVVVIAPSPLVMALAGTFAIALKYANENADSTNLYSNKAFESQIASEIQQSTVELAFSSIEGSVESGMLQTIEQLIDKQVTVTAVRSMSPSLALRSFNGIPIDIYLEEAASLASVTKPGDYSNEFENDLLKSVFETTVRASGMSSENASSLRKTLELRQQNGFPNTPIMNALAGVFSYANKDVWQFLLSCLQDCPRRLKIANRQVYDELLSTALTDVFGLKLGLMEKNKAWQNVAKQSTGMILHKDFCIVSEFPESLNLDNRGRASCEDGPAFTWKDGWSLHYWNGVRVSRRFIENLESMTVDDIKAEPNLEIRRMLLERYGMKRFLIDSSAKELHRDEYGVLYVQELDQMLDPIVMVKVVNSTAEPDGTFKDYFLRVPPHIRTAKEGVAWTFGVSKEEYLPVVQT